MLRRAPAQTVNGSLETSEAPCSIQHAPGEELCDRHAFSENWITLAVGELFAQKFRQRRRLKIRRAWSAHNVLQHNDVAARFFGADDHGARRFPQHALQTERQDLGWALWQPANADGHHAVRRVELPADLQPLLNVPGLNSPTEPRGQPAHQFPSLNDSVRTVVDDQFCCAGDGAGGRGVFESLFGNAAPEFETAPVEIGRDAPVPPTQAKLELMQPGIRRRHGARRIDPAETVVDDLLSVLSEIV